MLMPFRTVAPALGSPAENPRQRDPVDDDRLGKPLLRARRHGRGGHGLPCRVEVAEDLLLGTGQPLFQEAVEQPQLGQAVDRPVLDGDRRAGGLAVQLEHLAGDARRPRAIAAVRPAMPPPTMSTFSDAGHAGSWTRR